MAFPTGRDAEAQLGSTARRRSLSRSPSAAAGRRRDAADVARALSRTQSAVAGRRYEAAEVVRSLSRAPSAAGDRRHEAADVVRQLDRTASRRSLGRSPSAKRLQAPQQLQGDDLVQQLRLGPGLRSLIRSRSAASGGNSAQAGTGSRTLSRACSAAGSRAGAAQQNSQQVHSARSAMGGAREQGPAAHSIAAALQRQASSRSLHEERRHQHNGCQRSVAQTPAQVGSSSL